ncbi:30S ribosomal protein S8 [Patescibacteria group bacterium]
MMSDPIADMLTRIKNATRAGKVEVVLPHSRIKESVAKILKNERYVMEVSSQGELPKKNLKIVLRYEDKESVITDIKRKSKPGIRLYVRKHMIPRVVGGMGISIISTPQGLMTGRQAKKLGIGGELICEIW